MLAIVCSTLIWIALVSLLCSLGQAIQEGIVHLRRLHRIPCSHCAFYTGDYRLKCTVHPCRALTEDAIHCLDYEPSDIGSIATVCSHSQPCPTSQWK